MNNNHWKSLNQIIFRSEFARYMLISMAADSCISEWNGKKTEEKTMVSMKTPCYRCPGMCCWVTCNRIANERGAHDSSTRWDSTKLQNKTCSNCCLRGVEWTVELPLWENRNRVRLIHAFEPPAPIWDSNEFASAIAANLRLQHFDSSIEPKWISILKN